MKIKIYVYCKLGNSWVISHIPPAKHSNFYATAVKTFGYRKPARKHQHPSCSQKAAGAYGSQNLLIEVRDN